MNNDIYKFYAVILALVETIFIFFSIKYYNDEKYGWIYQLLSILSGVITFIGLIVCLQLGR